MEPISPQSGADLIRPAGALQGDLTAVLREGRVLTGEVISRLDGGTLLLGIGGRQVPAETGVELEPGQRFTVVVEHRDGELQLRLLPEERPSSDPALLRAVRGLLADERPLGAALGSLGEAIRAELAAGGRGAPEAREALAELLASVDAQRFAPGLDGAALEALLGRGEGAFAAALAAAAAEAGVDSFQAALSALTGELLAALRAQGGQEMAGDRALLSSALAAVLRGLAGERVEGALSPSLLAALTARVERGLRLQLAGAGEAGARLASELRGLGGLAGREGALLRALLNSEGILGRSTLADSLIRATYAGLDRGLRGRLLDFLLDVPQGALRETASNALRALDLEQLLNAARREFGEPLHYVLPVPDGAASATAHLFVLDRDGRGAGGQGEAGEDSFRVVVGVDLSRLGPIRADLLLRADQLALRLRVGRPDTARRLRRLAGELEERLTSAGRTVRIAVLEAGPEELGVERLARDIRFLREQHLMDVKG